MAQNQDYLFKDNIPKIEFYINKKKIPKEETVSIRWNVQSAKSIKFWQTSILPFSNQPIDWLNLFRIGKEVKSEDSIEVHPDKTTAYFLVAQGQLGISGYRQIVEVPSHEEPIAATYTNASQ